MLELTHDGQLRLTEFPAAVTAVSVPGPIASRYADLGLHRVDLQRALDMAVMLRDARPESPVIADALWVAAIALWAKSFQHSVSRAALKPDNVYTEDLPREVCEYFMKLQDKHLIHDENAFVQVHPVAILNRPTDPTSVAGVRHVAFIGDPRDEGTIRNLCLLAETALSYVLEQLETCEDKIYDELNALPYDELAGYPKAEFKTPGVDDIAATRGRRS